MVPTTAALAEPLPLISPIALDPTTAVCGIIRLDRGDQTHDPDHRVLRIEPVGDARQEQERGDQREGELAIAAIDAGRELHRARGDDATEGGAGMPEEIDRTEKAPERVGDHEHIGPEQYGMREPGQLHHQQENQQPDDVVVLRERSLRIDRDPFELIVEMNESPCADAEIDSDQDMVRERRQPFVEVVLLIHEENLQSERDRHHARDEFQRSAEAGVEEPDQPGALNRRQDKDQITRAWRIS